MTAQLVELGATLLDPWAGAARAELVLEKLARTTRLLLRGGVPVLLECAVCELDVALGRFDVDPHVPRQREPQLAPTLDAVRAQQTPHARQERAQSDVVRGRRIVPHRASARRLPADRMPAAINQAGEDDPGLTTGKPIFQAFAGALDGQAAAQEDPEARSRPGGRDHHGGAIVLPCNTNVNRCPG